MNSPVDKIKERLSIVDVISSYLTVSQAGKNFKARCPFHNEKTPSFFISPDRGTYYCFGCSAKGDIFSFVQQFEGTDFIGSLKLLAERAGIVLENNRSSGESRDEMERFHQIMDEAAEYFETMFAKNPEARSYLLGRGLSDSTIQSFRIGYAPDTWRSVSEHLIAKGFKQNDLEKVGLIKESEKGFYDRFRGRIIFPISDSSGRVIAFSGRIFGKPDTEEAKYLNSPDTPLFNKSHVLFGIDKAKAAIRARGYSIVVEGQMDLILSHQASFANTVAVSGTALADTVSDNESKINNLGLIRRLSPNVIFAFDGDEAGIRAASRAAMIALSLDMQVKIARIPEGKDPADIIREDPDSWKSIIRDSVNIVSFHIDRICQAASDMRIRGKKIRDVVFPFLSMIGSAIERSSYITEVHSKTGLPERSIIEDFENYERTNPGFSKETENKDIQEIIGQSRRDSLERRLFGIMFWYEHIHKKDEDIEALYTAFAERIGREILKKMREIHEPFADTLAFEAETWYGTETLEPLRDMKELVLNLEEELLTEEKIRLSPFDTEDKLARFDTIIKRIEEIKQSRSL